MHRNPDIVSTKQERIATLAKQSPRMGFTSLAYLMGLQWLVEVCQPECESSARFYQPAA